MRPRGNPGSHVLVSYYASSAATIAAYPSLSFFWAAVNLSHVSFDGRRSQFFSDFATSCFEAAYRCLAICNDVIFTSIFMDYTQHQNSNVYMYTDGSQIFE
jgi:hypothetical protein